MALRYVAIVNNEERPIVADGQSVLNVEEFNGAFDFENAINSGYAIGMKFPISGNEATFRYAHIKEVISRDNLIPVKVYDGAELVYNGSLLVKKIVKNGRHGFFDCDFVSSSFNVAIFGQTLQDVFDKEIELGNTTEEIAETIKNWPASPEAPKINFIPTKVVGFYEGVEGMEAFANVLNYYQRYDAVVPSNQYGEVLYSIAPSFGVLWMLEKIYEHYGYGIRGPVFSDARMQKVKILGLHALDKIGSVTSAILQRNAPITITGPADVTDMDTVLTDFTIDQQPSSVYKYPVMAGVQYYIVFTVKTGTIVTSSVLNIRRSFGGAAIVTIDNPEPNTTYVRAALFTYPANTVEGISLGVSTGDQCDIEHITWNIRVASNGLNLWNQWRGRFVEGECMPRIQISEFLKALRKTYNIRFDVDDVKREVYVEFNPDTLKTATTQVIQKYRKQHQINNRDKQRVNLSFNNTHFKNAGYDYLGAFDTDGDVFFGAGSDWPGAILYVRARNIYLKDGHTGEKDGVYQSEYSGGGKEDVAIATGVQLPGMVFEALADDPTDFYYPKYEGKGSSYWGELGANGYPLIFINDMGFAEHLASTPAHTFATPYNLDQSGNLYEAYSLAPIAEAGTAWNDLWLPWLNKAIDGDEIEIEVPMSEYRADRRSFYYVDGVRYMLRSWRKPIGRQDGWMRLILRRV